MADTQKVTQRGRTMDTSAMQVRHTWSSVAGEPVFCESAGKRTTAWLQVTNLLTFSCFLNLKHFDNPLT